MKVIRNNSPICLANQCGFTLLEIMIALVLISLVIVSIIELSSANLRNLATSKDQIEAVMLANSKMREILDLDKIEDGVWNETDDQGYSYEITITEIMKERTELLSVKLEEITLTTNWMKNNKKKQFILKTAKLVSRLDTTRSGSNSVQANH